MSSVPVDHDEDRKVQSTCASVHAGLLLHGANPFKKHFSSTPLDPDQTSSFSDGAGNLTNSERAYLNSLLEHGDANLIERATQRLRDPLLFPPIENGSDASKFLPNCNNAKPIDSGGSTSSSLSAAAAATAAAAAAAAQALIQSRTPRKRDSHLQRELFRLHETQSMQPSDVLKRLVHKNSILDTSDMDVTEMASMQNHPPEFANPHEIKDDPELSDPFKDVSGWLDGSQGIEVSGNGKPLDRQGSSQAQDPFLILGTSADDVSCHPHVLSPPLMESLQHFAPEPVAHHNFWLKYSLVRDGPSLWTLLRQVRASEDTFIAIETVDGHVFGSFTCKAWRLSQGWYGQNTDAFLWKMRRSRSEASESLIQKAFQEAEVQVYPYRVGNAAVQYCSKNQLMLGQGEMLLPVSNREDSEHYGHGLYLDSSLEWGTTSNSETFGNPCLVDSDLRGSKFEVANLEVWTLTPHSTVHDAETAELSAFFLDGARHGTDKNLDILRILVGGPM